MNNNARNFLAQCKDYSSYKNERITPEFLKNVNMQKKDGWKLADIITDKHPIGLGKNHSSAIAGEFQVKFAPRNEGPGKHTRALEQFLTGMDLEPTKN